MDVCLLVAVCSVATTDAPTLSFSYAQTMQRAKEANRAVQISALDETRARLRADGAARAHTPTLKIAAGPAGQVAQTGSRPGLDAGATWQGARGTQIAVDASELTGKATGALQVSLNQALLREGWYSGAWASRRRAELEALQATQRHRLSTNTELFSVHAAYWRLAFAQAEVLVKERSLARARQQFDDTSENIHRGILAEAEIYVVEENLVFFEQELSRAQEAQSVAQHQLAALLALPADPIAAADALAWDATDPNVGALLAQVSEQSPQIAVERFQLELSRVNQRETWTKLLPKLDVRAAARRSGPLTGGDAKPVYELGLSLDTPLWWSSSWALVEEAKVALEQAELRLVDQVATVEYQVRDLCVRLRLGLVQAGLAGRGLTLAQKKLDAEMTKYQNGISTLNDVVRFQRELDQAALGASRAWLRQREDQGRLTQALGGFGDVGGH